MTIIGKWRLVQTGFDDDDVLTMQYTSTGFVYRWKNGKEQPPGRWEGNGVNSVQVKSTAYNGSLLYSFDERGRLVLRNDRNEEYVFEAIKN